VISESKMIYNRKYARVFFDFETTYDDVTGMNVNKNKVIRDGVTQFEQVEFAYSTVTDVKIKFKDILESFKNDNNIEFDVTCLNLIIK
jgi:hypothetical protein